jgi:hypothetical protein
MRQVFLLGDFSRLQHVSHMPQVCHLTHLSGLRARVMGGQFQRERDTRASLMLQVSPRSASTGDNISQAERPLHSE